MCIIAQVGAYFTQNGEFLCFEVLPKLKFNINLYLIGTNKRLVSVTCMEFGPHRSNVYYTNSRILERMHNKQLHKDTLFPDIFRIVKSRSDEIGSTFSTRENEA